MKRNIYILTAIFLALFFAGSATVTAQTPFVKVIQPNKSGIQWSQKTTHLISWNDNFTRTVNIDLLRYNSGGTLVADYSLAQNLSGSTYSWYIYKDRSHHLIPVGSGYYYKIRVSSTVDPALKDESNKYFKIVALAKGTKVHVIQPNHSGVQWGQKTTHLVSWKDNISGTVNVDLLRYNSGGTLVADYSLAQNLSGSTYSWYIYKDRTHHLIPVGSGYYYKIRVSSTVDPAVKDESDKYFKILALAKGEKVHVIQPNHSGVQWGQKTTHLVSWKDNISGTVNIDLLRYNSGGTLVADYSLAQNLSGSTHSWYIYKDRTHHLIPVGSGYYYKIRVSSTVDPAVKDESNKYFKILALAKGEKVRVIQPNKSGIQWGQKTTHLISWKDNISGTVNIDLLRYNSGGTLVADYSLAQNLSGSTHSWYIYKDRTHHLIPVGSGYYYKIRVSSTVDPAVKDESNKYFKILALAKGTKVRVIQPNRSGIEWGDKTTQLVSWKDNISGTVNIDLLRYNSGGTLVADYSLAQNLSGSTHSWYIYKDRSHHLIPVGSGYYYKIRVSSTVDPAVKDESNKYFKILALAKGAKVHVIQPNKSGIQWGQKTTHLVSWKDNISGTVNIDLLRYNSGGTLVADYSLAQNLSGSTYSWYIYKDRSHHLIPVGSGYYYKIRVSSTVDPTVKDESDKYFKILALAKGEKVHVVQPNKSGIQWGQKTTHLISWKDNISGTVNVDLLRYNSGGTLVADYSLAQNLSGSTYSWYIYKDRSHHLIPVGSSYYYKIRVSSTVDPTVKDESDKYFKIILQPTIDVYPNPSTTHVTVKFGNKDNENYTLFLFNRYNMRVMYRQVNTTYLKEIRINTFDLPNGIYFLKLTSGKQVISRKIIVQH